MKAFRPQDYAVASLYLVAVLGAAVAGAFFHLVWAGVTATWGSYPVDNVLLASERHDWQTPDDVLDLVRALGPISLDPCTDDGNPCEAKYPLTHRGLEADWRNFGVGGITYVNPPYGKAIGQWVTKCIMESLRDLEIVLLTPARPDTDWYDRARLSCKAWCEVRGRLTFRGAPSTAPFPSAIHYWGPRPFLFAHEFQQLGRVGVRSW